MSKTDTPVTLSTDEKLAIARGCKNAIDKASTADELTEVIRDNYGTLGHKTINRMILGQTPEKALRIDAS